MTLRVGLSIGGDSAQAQAALREISGALMVLDQYSDKAAGGARRHAAASDEMAAAQRRAAGSLADLRAQFNPTFAVIQRYQTTVAAIRAAHTAGALSSTEMSNALARERREALASIAAIKGRTNALQQMEGATNSARAGMQQLGFQAGDFFTQLSMGANPFVAFTVQAQQAVGAIQMMTMSGGQATGMLGRFATVMSGPVGIGLGIVLPLVGILATKLFETAEASDAVSDAGETLEQSLSNMATFFDMATGAILRQNAALIENARLQRLDNLIEIENRQREATQRIRDLVEGAGTFDVSFSGTFGSGSVGRPTISNRRNPLAAAINAAGGDQQAIAAAVGSVARGGGRDGPRARELLRLMAEAERDQVAANRLAAELRSFQSGTLDPSLRQPGARERGGRGGRGSGAGTSDAERAAAALTRQIDQAQGSIQRINDQWSEQPRLVVRAAAATRELNEIITDAQARLARGGLGDRQVEALTNTIEQARGAIAAVKEGLARPFREIEDSHERQMQLQGLVLAGRDDEAAALAIILDYQERYGDLTREQREAILANVRAEREMNEALERRAELMDAYRSAIGDVRGSLEQLLSGQGDGNFFGSLRRTAQQLQGRLLTEQIFGPALRDLDRYVREETAIESSVDIMTAGTERAGNAAAGMAAAVEAATGRIAAAGRAVAGGEAGAVAQGTGAPAPAKRRRGSKQGDAEGDNADIVVTAARISQGAVALPPSQFFPELANSLIDPLTSALDDAFGTRFFSRMSGVLSGALAGYMRAGPVGAVLGGLASIRGLPDSLQSALGKGLKGAETGTMIAGIGRSLGLRTSSTGGAIGGAIGSFVPIPGGEIIGSVIGSLVGGLFKKTPYGTAVVGRDGEASVTGNKADARRAASGLAEAVQGGIASIAERLGGELGDYRVSIGTYRGRARVSASGKRGKLKGGDVRDFGKDGEEAAVAFAIQSAIAQGAIAGLSAAVQKALGSSSDIDKAVAEAVKVQDLEIAIGGIGAAIAKEVREFDAQARERLRIARAYGFDVLAVEKYNAEQRLALNERLLESQVGSLQRLVEEMTTGSLFEGSALDRRTALLTEIGKAKADLDAGKEGAADRLARLFEQLNALSKEIYGTTGGFAADRSSILDEATAAIARANARIVGAQAASDPALAQTNAALDENNDQNAQMLAELGVMNTRLAALVAANDALAGGLATARLADVAGRTL